MSERDEFDILRNRPAPAPRESARERALAAALKSFDENLSPASQGSPLGRRLRDRAASLWSEMMRRKFLTTPAVAGLLVLPLAGYAAWQIMGDSPFGLRPAAAPETLSVGTGAPPPRDEQAAAEKEAPAAPMAQRGRDAAADLQPSRQAVQQPGVVLGSRETDMAQQRLYAPAAPGFAASPMPAPEPAWHAQPSRDRFESFQTNPLRLTAEEPVSTFSIDVDTASYAFMRRALNAGRLPDPDSVRVEELINYFPYDWVGSEGPETPFHADVAMLPTPWNEGTRLMHVAVKGYDIPRAQRPPANLVLLVDTSGSMNAPDRLPLLKSAFRLLVNQMTENDTVSIVAYAGRAGVVLEPTRGGERGRILAALDRLEAHGSTAGEAGIREAYRLAESAFVEGGVNRVLLATDGDFNVGQTGDDELLRLVEDKRRSGVMLSVFGFGRGNYNDRLMQLLAQNGNGTAAYIDTLAEAEKTLVQEAGATLFPIAADVKIQVEFNPERIAEYRLIGYETRALNREDFNDDNVDAGEIGSGHTVTAIYEVTPVDSPARAIDDLRYGQARPASPQAAAGSDEYAFVKIRYKLPGEDESRLISQAVTPAHEVASFGAASEDRRFSVAVAAFGQKLRGTSQVGGFGYDRIAEIAAAARGADPFGYRAEFLSLVRLAAAIDGSR